MINYKKTSIYDENTKTSASDSSKPLPGLKQVNPIIISSCCDCPFNYSYDMGVGYGCKIDTHNRIIKESNNYQQITPDWCQVKNGDIVVKYKK